MKFQLCVLGLIVLFSSSCASRKFKKDYTVVDASAKEIPEWIEEPNEWAEDSDKENYKASRYYVYSTEAKNGKSIACKIAKAQVANEVASEISQFINSTFAQTQSGDATDKDSKLSEYVEDRLVKEVQQSVVGATVLKTYWEKRHFSKELGAKKDWDGHVCSALMRIKKENLENALTRAEKKLLKTNKTDDQEKIKEMIAQTKEKVLAE